MIRLSGPSVDPESRAPRLSLSAEWPRQGRWRQWQCQRRRITAPGARLQARPAGFGELLCALLLRGRTPREPLLYSPTVESPLVATPREYSAKAAAVAAPREYSAMAAALVVAAPKPCELLASALDQRGARLALIWSRSASVAARAAVLKLSPELAYRIARDELMMRPVPSDV